MSLYSGKWMRQATRRYGYVNIPLPKELVEQIEKIMKIGKYGYKTRAEFVKEAVREKLRGLYK